MDQQQAHRRHMLDVLQRWWGYSSFRDPQEAVILNALAGNDSLVVMATGGGKSLCYQVPALVSGRVCVVVSPLIALMEDQVAALTARGVKAAMLGSAQSSAEVKRRAWAGEFALVYITPELATSSTHLLQSLHAAKRIGLIAVDESHCLSEWGHDFRPAYRQLGCLREALPDVPLMALTATATQRVRQDIVSQLRMGQPGGPPLRQWVMSFQRHNLHLSVTVKSGSAPGPNLAALVGEARQAAARGARLEPTLIYTQTTREVDELQAFLQAAGVTAVKYHAKLPVGQRNEAQRAFQRDDAAVMVASLAFGMGIDKPNIRRIIHWGVPSSLESYYQQAGRAGRDGLPARCALLWSPADFVMQDFIKGATGLDGWNLESHSRGMAALRAYTGGGECRHASLVNFFQPGALPPEGPCAGGCDNCARRADAAAAAEASGAPLAPGCAAGLTDITQPAKLLVAAVKGLKGAYGMSRPVSLLRGSKGRSIEPWMLELLGPDGRRLHGAGSSRSDDWWKGLVGVLMAQGLLESQSRKNAGGSSYSVVSATAKGAQLLLGDPPVLAALLPVHMEAEAHKQQLREAAERARAAARTAAQQQRDEAAAERQQLLAALRDARKATADALGQAPDVLVNDVTLSLLAELRPATREQLELVSGFGQAALQHFAGPLLEELARFCAGAKHLAHDTDWAAVRRSREAAAAFAGTQPAPGDDVGAQLLQGGGAAAPSPGAGAAAAPPPAGALHADDDLYSAFLEARVLGEPKNAAQAAWDRWQAGESAQSVADNRDRPIQVSSVVGYLADAAAAEGASAGGCPAHLAARLRREAGLGGSPAADELLRRAAGALGGRPPLPLSAAKRAVPEEVTFGMLKAAAALLALGALGGEGARPAAAQPAQGQPGQQEQEQQQQWWQEQRQVAAGGGDDSGLSPDQGRPGAGSAPAHGGGGGSSGGKRSGGICSLFSGKRRRATAVAPPAPPPAAAHAAAPAGQAHAHQQPSSTPPAAAAGAGPSPAPAATPPGAGIITRQAVLELLYGGASTAPELLRRLGASGNRQREAQVQDVLQALLDAGDQVVATPECGSGGVDLHSEAVRFIAF